MFDVSLYISHHSALHFWRTNPPRYVLEGESRNIRVLKHCPSSDAQIRGLVLSEAEFGERPIDVIVPEGAPRPRSILHYHVQKAQVPPRSLYPLRDGIHIVSPAFCFVQLCKSLSFVAAAELGMELCGTYALRPGELEEAVSRDYQLMSAASLCRKAAKWRDVHGLTRAREVAKYLADGSASPMESKVYLLLCLPQQHGGYNIERPEINAVVKLSEEERLVMRQESVRPDFLWRDAKLIVEYDGAYHDCSEQVAKDAKRRVVLEAMGFTVITIKKQQVFDPLAFDGFASIVAKKTGRRVRPLTLKQRAARDALRDELLAGGRPDRLETFRAYGALS